MLNRSRTLFTVSARSFARSLAPLSLKRPLPTTGLLFERPSSHINLSFAREFADKKTTMGVDITTIKEGDGTNFPKKGNKVECHYVLTLEDGKKIDSSRDRGSTFKFNLGKGEVIKGWDQGVAQMSKGQRVTMKISPDLGYGAQGIPGTIPKNATLVFDVELINFT